MRGGDPVESAILTDALAEGGEGEFIVDPGRLAGVEVTLF